MEPMTVDEFRKALSGAGWKMGLHEFCAALDWPVDDYARQKFRAFAEMARILGQFEASALEKLIEDSRRLAA